MGWLSEEAEARCRAWMAAAQRGDAAAYDCLLRAVLPALRGFVRSRVQDAAAAEDVVQNVLLSVHRARHTYRPERPLSPWLRAVARNAVMDHLRSRQRRVRRELPLEAAETVGVEAESGAEARGATGLSPELQRALARLPAAQREAVELVQLRGLSVAEAAARVGIKPGALKVRAHRGYRALRGLLGRSDPP